MRSNDSGNYLFQIQFGVYPQLPINTKLYCRSQGVSADGREVYEMVPFASTGGGSRTIAVGETFQKAYCLQKDEGYGLLMLDAASRTPVSRVLLAPGEKAFVPRLRAIRTGRSRSGRYSIGPFKGGRYQNVSVGGQMDPAVAGRDYGKLVNVIEPAVGNGVVDFERAYVALLNPEFIVQFMAKNPHAPDGRGYHDSAPVDEDGRRPLNALFMTKSADPAHNQPEWFPGAFYLPSAKNPACFKTLLGGHWMTTATFFPRRSVVEVRTVAPVGLIRAKALSEQISNIQRQAEHLSEPAEIAKARLAMSSLDESMRGQLRDITRRFSIKTWPESLRTSPLRAASGVDDLPVPPSP